MSSSKLDLENKAKLRSFKQAHQIYKEQDFTDSVYIIEGCYMTYLLCPFYKFVAEILGTRKCRKGLEYHIKWEDYDETTWSVNLDFI